MKPPVFLDTGAIFALADADDGGHQTARAIYHDPKRRFFLHEWIFAESFSLLTKRLHKGAALHMIGALRSSPRIEVVAVSQTSSKPAGNAAAGSPIKNGIGSTA